MQVHNIRAVNGELLVVRRPPFSGRPGSPIVGASSTRAECLGLQNVFNTLPTSLAQLADIWVASALLGYPSNALQFSAALGRTAERIRVLFP